ncbi:toll-like receptor 2 [Glandiceps talaboti]
MDKIAALGLTFHHQYPVELFEYHVCVTSCEKDQHFICDIILPRLEQNWGLKVYYNERDIVGGISPLTNISRGIFHSKITLIVLSQNFIESSWSIYEFGLAFNRKYKENRDSLVILQLGELVEIPIELETLVGSSKYIDFSKGVREDGWLKLQTALQGRIGKESTVA